MNQQYTYLVTHLATGHRYYGSRYSKMADPSELGVSYFTSSNVIRSIIDREGVAAFKWEVRLTCSSPEQARTREAKVLSRINARDRTDWFNKHNGDGQFLCQVPRYGPLNSNFGNKWNAAQRQRMSDHIKNNRGGLRGPNNPNFGKAGFRCWITNPATGENKLVPVSEVEKYNGFIRGRTPSEKQLAAFYNEKWSGAASLRSKKRKRINGRFA